MSARSIFAAPLALLAVIGCDPRTTRPSIVPLPNPHLLEVRLHVAEATRNLAWELDQDSIPVSRTEPDDGWLETDWFDVATLKWTKARPLGPGIVKLRAWVDPSKPGYSCITVETVFRPLADPSRDGRLLERQVSDSDAVAKLVAHAVRSLKNKYSDLLTNGDVDSTPSCSSEPTTPKQTPARSGGGR